MRQKELLQKLQTTSIVSVRGSDKDVARRLKEKGLVEYYETTESTWNKKMKRDHFHEVYHVFLVKK